MQLQLSLFHPYQIRRPAELLSTAALGEHLGAHRVWCGASQGFDALLAVTLVALRFPRLRFGLSVALTPFKHPVQVGIEAWSLAALSEDFIYGIGVGDAGLRRQLGGPEWRAAELARAYVTAARSVARDGGDPVGEPPFGSFDVRPFRPAGGPPGRVALAALRAGMAEVAGESADACVTWLAPADYLAKVTTPSVRAGALRAGRATPPVIALLPYVGEVSAPDAIARARQLLSSHLGSRTYRVIPETLGFECNGAGPPAEFLERLVLRGALSELGDRMEVLREAGTSEVALAVYGDLGGLPRGALAALAADLD